MADLGPFATVEDLTQFWKAPDDSSRATYLLKMASNRLRLLAEDLDINLDSKAEASEPFNSTVQWVVMEAVKRALLTPTDAQPVDTWQQTAGPYSENIKYTNPSGDLWFKKTELGALGLTGRQSLGSISTSRTDIYGS